MFMGERVRPHACAGTWAKPRCRGAGSAGSIFTWSVSTTPGEATTSSEPLGSRPVLSVGEWKDQSRTANPVYSFPGRRDHHLGPSLPGRPGMAPGPSARSPPRISGHARVSFGAPLGRPRPFLPPRPCIGPRRRPQAGDDHRRLRQVHAEGSAILPGRTRGPRGSKEVADAFHDDSGMCSARRTHRSGPLRSARSRSRAARQSRPLPGSNSALRSYNL